MKKILVLLLVLLTLTGCTPGTVSNGTVPSTEPTTTDATQATADATEPGEEAALLNVHFIDVGQADCILLESEGEYIIVDGGNVADSSLVVSYLDQLGVTKLEAVVATHAHEDHAGGLSGVLAVFETAAVYAPTRTYSSNCFDNFVYYTDQQGLEITIPSPGDVIEFGDATATVLGPVQSYANTNDTSIVLMVEYGSTRFLLTGDMETSAENDILDYWGENFDWSADVLKVGHHGSDTSTGYRFLNAVMPTYGVISVGAGNSYGHPCEGPLSKLRDAEVTVYRTDELGSIVASSDGETIHFTWGNKSVQPEVPDVTQPQETTAPTETTGTGDAHLTVAEAIALCKSTGETATTEKYYITGTVTKITNETYGNLYIEDETGSLFIYGIYSADGADRFDAMSNPPAVGDTVTLYGVLVNYKDETPEMKNAWLIDLVAGEPQKTDPTDATEATEPDEDADPTESSTYYIGNKNSKKLHLPTCGSLPAEKNQVIFYDYDEAIEAGYTPCSKCLK